MKLFIKNCFLALLCLYRSHQTTTPSRGQGAKTPTLRGLKAIAYIGSRYPCLLPKILKLSHLMIIVRQTFQSPFPPTHTFLSKVKSRLSVLASRLTPLGFPTLGTGLWLPDTRDRTLVLVSCFSNLMSHISNLISRFSHLASKTTLLSSLTLLLLLAPKVAFTQSTGVLSHNPAPVVIYGEIKSPHTYEYIEIILLENYLWNNTKLFQHQRFRSPVEEGAFILGTPFRRVFRFETEPISAPSYLTLKQGDDYIFFEYLAMPGDSIEIYMDDYSKNLLFSGRSADAYRLQRELFLISEQNQFDAPRIINSFEPENLLNEGNNRELLERNSGLFGKEIAIRELDPNEYLEKIREKFVELGTLPDAGVFGKYSDRISSETLDLIAANRFAKELDQFYNSIRYLYQISGNKGYPDILDSLEVFFKENLKTPPLMDFSQGILFHSAYYAESLISHAKTASYFDNEAVFEKLRSNYEGILREKLLALYLQRHFKHLDNNMELLTQTLEMVEIPWLREGLEKIQTNIHLGSSLVDYPLKDLDGNDFSLKELQGKLLLIDFWYTGCGACVQLFQNTLSVVEEHFAGNDDFVLVSISTDKTPAAWKKSVEGGKYTSKHALNLYSEGKKHPLLKHYNIFSYPHQLLVSPESTLLKSGGFPDSPEQYISLIEEYLKEVTVKPK